MNMDGVFDLGEHFRMMDGWKSRRIVCRSMKFQKDTILKQGSVKEWFSYWSSIFDFNIWNNGDGETRRTLLPLLEVFKRPSTNVRDEVSSVQAFIAFIQFDSFTFVFYFTIQTEVIPVDVVQVVALHVVVRPIRSLQLVCKPLQTISNIFQILKSKMLKQYENHSSTLSLAQVSYPFAISYSYKLFDDSSSHPSF